MNVPEQSPEVREERELRLLPLMPEEEEKRNRFFSERNKFFKELVGELTLAAQTSGERENPKELKELERIGERIVITISKLEQLAGNIQKSFPALAKSIREAEIFFRGTIAVLKARVEQHIFREEFLQKLGIYQRYFKQKAGK